MSDLGQAILDTLGRRPGQARFVQELRAAAGTPGTVDSDFEGDLQELESAGAIIIRPYYCGDPHLEDADLRIAALVEAGTAGDANAAAIAAIDSAWQRWIGDYLASHRCT
jgi:hypothetical protein